MASLREIRAAKRDIVKMREMATRVPVLNELGSSSSSIQPIPLPVALNPNILLSAIALCAVGAVYRDEDDDADLPCVFPVYAKISLDNARKKVALHRNWCDQE